MMSSRGYPRSSIQKRSFEAGSSAEAHTLRYRMIAINIGIDSPGPAVDRLGLPHRSLDR